MSQPGRPNTCKRPKNEEIPESKLRQSKHESTVTSVRIKGSSNSSSRNRLDNSSSQEDENKCANITAEEEKSTTSSTDHPQPPKAAPKNMVIYYGREALCLLAILLTTMASYQGSTPKIGRPPSPRPFFSPDSQVQDYPGGNLEAVSQQVSVSELSFVLYYSPWDAASQGARAPFADVAHFYQREAHFSAINCWQPGGECRLQYSKIKAWPVLMAYLPKNGLGVLYNGIWERDPMMRFVNSFLAPLKRLNDPEDLLQTMTGHDAIVVAFLDLQQDPLEWNVFYEAAVKWMHRDPFQDIRFSVVTGESRSKFGVDSGGPVLRMYLWNETVEYENRTWTVSGIESWAMQTVHRVALWITPSGFKSLSLSTFFKNGPVLLFFTPRNLLAESTDATEMMRQIGMEYYNCNGDTWIREMVREYLPEQRRAHAKALRSLRESCQGFTSTRFGSFRRPISSVTFATLMNGSRSQQTERLADFCQVLDDDDSMFRNRAAKEPHHCAARGDECSTPEQTTPTMRLRATGMLRSELDKRSPANLQRQQMRRRCELLFIDAERAAQNDFLGNAPFHLDQLQGIEGLGCTGNRSLTMLMMDSNIYHVFAERLGVDILTTKRRSAVFIVDPENESTYLLNPTDEVTLKSISRFIRKFQEGTLRRLLRSSHLDYAHTHSYAVPEKSGGRRDVAIEELNSKNFAAKLSRPGRSLLLFFYSSNCAFCTPVSQHLLQLGNIFSPLQEAGHIHLARIDGDKNDLPWPFTVAEYPTLIFYAGDTGSSRQFSISERNAVTLDQILAFTVANLKPPLRIYAIELTCAASRRSVKSLVNCLRSLRTEVQEAIGMSLRDWRRVATGSKSRTRIVRRLQLLEAFYLETFRVSEVNQCQSCDFTKLEGFCKRIVSVWGEERSVASRRRQ